MCSVPSAILVPGSAVAMARRVLRTFIAVRIPATPGLRALHARLSQLGDRFRPVALDNLHVTLKFLGDTAEEKVPEIETRLKRVIEPQPAMQVRLSGVGAFPHERRPSVLWVGLAGAEALCRIAGELERELVGLGFAPEGRAFQPHLTLLRIKTRPPEELFTILRSEANAELGMAEIDHVEFIESELGPRGSRYTTLARIALNGFASPSPNS